jgi:hypothetical protein
MSNFPGWRTMTGTQRRNAKMFAIFERARQYKRENLRRARAELVETVDGRVVILIDGLQWGGKRDESGAGDLTFAHEDEAYEAFLADAADDWKGETP